MLGGRIAARGAGLRVVVSQDEGAVLQADPGVDARDLPAAAAASKKH